MVTLTGNSIGDTATYTCNPGFELIGDPTTTCTAAVDGNSATYPAVPPPECSREWFRNITRVFKNLLGCGMRAGLETSRSNLIIVIYRALPSVKHGGQVEMWM